MEAPAARERTTCSDTVCTNSKCVQIRFHSESILNVSNHSVHFWFAMLLWWSSRSYCALLNCCGASLARFAIHNLVRNITIATLKITKRADASPQQPCELQNEHEFHQNNIQNYKTIKSCTAATLWMSKRAGGSPQQHCNSDSEQELHHSNIAND